MKIDRRLLVQIALVAIVFTGFGIMVISGSLAISEQSWRNGVKYRISSATNRGAVWELADDLGEVKEILSEHGCEGVLDVDTYIARAEAIENGIMEGSLSGFAYERELYNLQADLEDANLAFSSRPFPIITLVVGAVLFLPSFFGLFFYREEDC